MVFIIAEVGPNHDGLLKNALEIVHRVADSGADAVKFQTFQSGETVVSKNTPLAPYMERTGNAGDQNDLHETLGLTDGEFRKISDECKHCGIMFLSTPFDVPSVWLLQDLGVPLMKVPSGELTNPFLLRAIAKTGLDLIVSTGMAELIEIQSALLLVREEWENLGLKGSTQPELTLLHCTSAYPAPLEEVNLRAMDVLKKEFNVPVGYSDHTTGMLVPLLAVARGAKVIEKHVTPNPNLAGPDHMASLPLVELPTLVSEIRNAEQALGTGIKRVTESEKEVRQVARRSLAAMSEISAGQKFEIAMLTALRPETGISPMQITEIVGRECRHSYRPGELINVDELDDNVP